MSRASVAKECYEAHCQPWAEEQVEEESFKKVICIITIIFVILGIMNILIMITMLQVKEESFKEGDVHLIHLDQLQHHLCQLEQYQHLDHNYNVAKEGLR